jgi:hypothetical protein
MLALQIFRQIFSAIFAPQPADSELDQASNGLGAGFGA